MGRFLFFLKKERAMLQKIEEVKMQFAIDAKAVVTQKDLEELRLKYMGKKGLITNLMPMLKDVPNDQKREMGMKINGVKTEIENTLTTLAAELEAKRVEEQINNAEINTSSTSF